MATWGKKRDDLVQTIRDNGDGTMSVQWSKPKRACERCPFITTNPTTTKCPRCGARVLPSKA